MGYLMELNDCCGMELRTATLIILALYLYPSVHLLAKLSGFTFGIMEKENLSGESFAVYILAVIASVIIFIIPSILGFYAVLRRRRAFLSLFLFFNAIFLVLIVIAIVLSLVVTIWMLISVAIKGQSIGEDTIFMIVITVVTVVLLPFLYVIMSVVNSYYSKRC